MSPAAARILLAVAIAMLVRMPGAMAETSRSFLMLNDQAIEFIDGAPVFGYWRVLHGWDEQEKREKEVVDGVEFVIGEPFWKMVKDNESKYSVDADMRVGRNGQLVYREKPVQLGIAVGRLEVSLRWRDWIVALGTSADPKQATIKGPKKYLYWFNEKSLKGSYRQASAGTAVTLRIYTK